MKQKVNRNDFLKRVAESTGLSAATVKTVYDAMVDEIQSVVCSGKELSLTGFGVFVLKPHKGHPVQFDSSSDKVHDYVVLKFAPSDVLMSKLRANTKV